MLAVERGSRDHASGAGLARAVGVVDDHGAAQALRPAASELGPCETEVLAQEVVHRELFANLEGALGRAVHREGQPGHDSAPLSMAWVTGSASNRWPVAS